VIDTHCHLDRLSDARRAEPHDLAAVVTIATDHARLAGVLALAEADARTFAAVGIHPNSADETALPHVRDAIERALSHPKVVAVGESGIDLHWDRVPLATQLTALRWHGALARERDLALILHVRDPQGGSREASATTAAEIARLGHRRGILHCTNGDPELLDVALDLGWYVSFAGNLTYPSATAIHAAARSVPAERLLVETDAPFLAPRPHRGQENRPAWVRITAAQLATLRGDDPLALEARLDANARAVLRLP
jgi:TatD DNase family protein